MKARVGSMTNRESKIKDRVMHLETERREGEKIREGERERGREREGEGAKADRLTLLALGWIGLELDSYPFK